MMIPRSYVHWLMLTTNAYDHICKMNLCRSQSSVTYYQVVLISKIEGNLIQRDKEEKQIQKKKPDEAGGWD